MRRVGLAELIVLRGQHQCRDRGCRNGHHRQRGSDCRYRDGAVVVGGERNSGSERVPGECQWHVQPGVECVEGGDHVEPFGDSIAATRPKVETQRGKPGCGQGGEERLDHVVEAVAAVGRVWMAHDDTSDRRTVGHLNVGCEMLSVGGAELYGLHGGDGTLAPVADADQKIPIKMLNDRVLVKLSKDEGERSSTGGILIPATAQISKRLAWAEVVALGQNVRTAEVGDKVLFSPDERYEVELGGEDLIMLRERDLHAVAAKRIESSTGLYL